MTIIGTTIIIFMIIVVILHPEFPQDRGLVNGL